MSRRERRAGGAGNEKTGEEEREQEEFGRTHEEREGWAGGGAWATPGKRDGG